jgi:hypothetical protein
VEGDEVTEVVVRLLIEPIRDGEQPPTLWEGKPGESVTLTDAAGAVVRITMQELVIR